ncbi:MAG: hypothetical protein L0Y54_04535, partial [Sporichthyaceae bacterium]|nr:hypothetical protein [Sporichthyaceae bacterium]
MSQSPTLLRVLLVARHWQGFETFRTQYERAATDLAEATGEPRLRGLTISERQFERWYAGAVKTRPFPVQCRVLEHLFGHAIDDLLAPASASPDPLAPARIRPAKAARPEPLQEFPGADIDPFGDLEGQIVMAARRALRFSSLAQGSNVGPEALDQLAAEVARLASAYPREPLTGLLGDLVIVQDLTFRLLEGRQRPGQARDLYLMAGVASGMLAKASHDLRDPQSAMTQARAAYICAEHAGHPGLLSWIRGLQALIAYWAGWTHDSVHYAQLGAETITGATGSSTAWLPALEARAQAALGDITASRAAIARAQAARDNLVPDELDRLGGLLTFPAIRQTYYLAEAAVRLPDDRAGAAQAAAEASAGYSDPSIPTGRSPTPPGHA